MLQIIENKRGRPILIAKKYAAPASALSRTVFAHCWRNLLEQEAGLRRREGALKLRAKSARITDEPSGA